MAKVTVIGAGGYVFPIRLLIDLFSYPELRDSAVALHDIHEGRLSRTASLVQGIIERNRLNATMVSTLDRREALDGADYVIIAFQVGGVEAYRYDVEIPRLYRIDQCVGDTLGPGGVFRGLRTIAVLQGIAKDIRELCPEALVLQYANPMSINCWALNLLGIKTVGLCHSVQGTSKMLIGHLGLPYEEVAWQCAGINHQAWFTSFQHRGEDVYPRLRETMFAKFPSPALAADRSEPASERTQRGMDHQADDDHYYNEVVRTEIMRTFGYFHTESSHHGSEYTPWFRKNEETVKAYIFRRWDYYEISCSYQNQEQQDYIEKLCQGPLESSEEYGAQIIHACETGTPSVVYGNVPNWGAPGSDPAQSASHLISNLPRNCCVEVACLVNRNGIQPIAFGDLPPQCAALNRLCVNVQELAVLGGMRGDHDAVRQAVALDPLTGVHLTLPKINEMVDRLFEAEAAWLPQFS